MTDKREITRLEWALYADIRQLDRFNSLHPALNREKVKEVCKELAEKNIRYDEDDLEQIGNCIYCWGCD